jgi:nucleoside-triphosphatase THEP1
MGPYGVDMSLLDRLVESQLRLEPSIDVYLIDEIGIIGSWSERFVRAVTELLDSRKVVVAILRLKKGNNCTEQVRTRTDAILWEVATNNRGAMVGQVGDWIDSRLAAPARGDEET